MVDVMKRRERERVMLDVINQIQAEKEELIRVEQEKLTTQIIQQKSVEEIIFENKKKIEV